MFAHHDINLVCRTQLADREAENYLLNQRAPTNLLRCANPGGKSEQMQTPEGNSRRQTQRARLRRLPKDRRHLGPSADVPLLRPRRLLRLFEE